MAKELDLTAADHLLVIVPHQDDEILMAAGLIYEMLACQKKVTVCIVTNGDYECNTFEKGRLRLQETIDGLETLGLSKDNIIFLGYADTGMLREDSFLMRLYESAEEELVYESVTSNKTYSLPDKPEYHYERYGEHGSYNRKTLISDIREVLEKTSPDLILTTYKGDLHGDHEALFYLVREGMEGRSKPEQTRLFVSIVHSPEGDDTWPPRDTAFYTCPKGLDEVGLVWEERYILALPEGMRGGKREGNLKYEALMKYETALEPNAVEYLLSFIKDEEIFWEIR